MHTNKLYTILIVFFAGMLLCSNTYAACKYITPKPNVLVFKIKVFLEGAQGGGGRSAPTNRNMDVTPPLAVERVDTQVDENSIFSFVYPPNDFGTEGGTEKVFLSAYNDANKKIANCVIDLASTQRITLTGLSKGREYRLEFSSRDANRNHQSTPFVVFATPVDALAPTLLGDVSIVLTLHSTEYETSISWQRSDSDDLSHYSIEVEKSDELLVSATTLNTMYSAAFPANGELLSVSVYAVDDDGNASDSIEASVQLLDVVDPLPVENVLAQAGDRTIDVSWSNPSDIGVTGGTNMLEVSLSQESSHIETNTFTEPFPTDHHFDGLQNNAIYAIVLTTTDVAGNSTFVSVFATPVDALAPTLLGDVSIVLTLHSTEYETSISWQRSDSDDLSHYSIEVEKSDELLVSATTLNTMYSAAFPANGELLSVSVYAVDDDGNASDSIEASVQLLDVVDPLPVENVLAQAGDRTIDVSWSNPSDIGVTGGTNMLEVSLSQESSHIETNTFTEPFPTDHHFDGLQNNAIYAIVLTTTDVAGNSTFVSVFATPVDALAPTLLGDVSIVLTLHSTEYETSISWQRSDSDDLSHYSIEVEKSDELLVSATTLNTMYSAAFPANGELLSVSVYAVDDDGNASDSIEASVQLLDVVDPLPVENVLAQAGDRTIDVSWSNPSDIGVTGGTNMLEVSLSQESSHIETNTFTEPFPTDHHFDGLQNNAIYAIVLTTTDVAGNSTFVSVFATPVDALAPTAPSRIELSLVETEELLSTATLEIEVFESLTDDDIEHNHILVMQSSLTLTDDIYDKDEVLSIEVKQDGSTVLVVVSHIDDDNNKGPSISATLLTKTTTERLNFLVKSAVEGPHLSPDVTCHLDYARNNPDWRENRYECMRAQVPGVQQLHSALSVLREHNSPQIIPSGENSPHIMIIDRFSSGITHGHQVSDIFESVSANLRVTCDTFLLTLSVGECYELMDSEQVGNLSLAGLYFEANQQDTSQVSQITGDLFTSVGARVGVGAGNKRTSDPLSGPNQGRLHSIINLGQTTVISGWFNTIFVNTMVFDTLVGRRDDAFLISGLLDRESDSCEDPEGNDMTAERCVLFPYTYYYFDDNTGDREFITGTSGSVALYSGVMDLLLTMWEDINSSEADAIVRSCAVDLTYEGFTTYENYRGVGEIDHLEQYYGSVGVDATTGLGRADLMCLLDSGSDTGLVEDPRSVIDCSFKDDYPHPDNREVSRLRISHCEGDE